jgi:segregation and condensation protein B
MSLKAKLEAVIYAAEEPVTLAQLSVLFAGEALAWKAEQALELPMAAVVADSTEDSSAELLDVVLDAEARATTPEDKAEGEMLIAELTGEAPQAEADEARADDSTGSGESTAPEGNAEAEPAAALSAEEAELEARRQERRREKEARETLREILDELIAEYASDGRGLEIREIAGGFRMGTKPEMHDSVRAFVKSLKPAMKLSLPALETLAVIAYKQPVTAPEVAEIRGVDSAGVLGSLMSRKLIATAGRKQVIGRPMLYKTTKEFLLRFGLKDVNELPSMEEFEKMAALELSEDAVDEGAAQSGDLFAESESATVPAAGGDEDEAEAEEQEVTAVGSISEETAEKSRQTEQTEQAEQPEQAALEQNSEEPTSPVEASPVEADSVETDSVEPDAVETDSVEITKADSHAEQHHAEEIEVQS